MNGFSIALPAVCLLLSGAAALFAAKAVATVQDLRDLFERYKTQQTDSPSASGSLSARVNELEQTIEVLANRVKMQRVRAAATHAEKTTERDPDPYTDPDRWRQQMNARLSRDKFGLAKT